MAIPIRTIPNTTESSAEIEARLDLARVQHAKAILSAYELLQDLQDARVLDLLRGVLGAGDAIVTKLAVATSSEESINAVRNLISLGRILSSIDPDVLHNLADELTSKKPKETVTPKPSLWRAIRLFSSADSRRALVGSAAFLQAFGRALAAGKTKR
jgi:uncharacterized protein YjgD (DUF1641 family)